MTTSTQATYDPRADWTAPLHAEPDPLLSLTRAGAMSFVANDLERFSAWIERAGFRCEAPRSPSEYRRFVRGRALIVAYNTRTLLVQGAQPQATIALLSEVAR